MQIRPISVPYRYDERNAGSGQGPAALLEAGLLDRLRSAGVDAGEPVESHLPDDERIDGPIAVNVGRLGAYTARLVAEARASNEGVFVLSGDDTATVGVVAGLQIAHGAGAAIGVVWLDAHGDFNTPETSYSGILAGMPVAILAGLAGPIWRGAAGLAAPVPTDRILIAGVRELDEREATLLHSTDVQLVRSTDADSVAVLAARVRRLAVVCDYLFLHVDLDLLDPTLVPSSATPCPDGLSVREAVAMLKDVLASGKVAVVSIAGLNPGGGKLGQTSISSALALLEGALPGWTEIPRGVADDDQS